ncbi:nucleoside hydrolase [Kriegella aquimaris]|uniref:Pyrimidine-specific ribonucleoside hydrolase n=1 Tax=Kriegella aquimaris TaxID=192904 RepID=A0A1G9QIM8_9FLAO|nr:nucleoside hydrolase [Kriegella aquimaris]SDM10869.1 pyrimidine-specific ribonucleoside hydrolase [Kriegella aquimaris]
MNKKQVWIDTDLSVGMKRHKRDGYCDVDDGYAVLQLMKADNIDICGISAIFGNTLIENAFSLSKKMADEFSSYKIPVYKGADKGINIQNVTTNDAVEALAEALKHQKMIIMAIGPATNVGLLLLKYPELKSQIQEVVLVAGRRKPTDYFKIGNQGNHAQDLNFDLDNDAFRILFEHEVPVVLCPFEISNKVWLKKEDVETLKNGDIKNEWLAEASEPWLKQWLDQGAKGFNPFDVLASHYIMAPEDIISEPLNARLEIHLDDTVKQNNNTVYKQYLLCDNGDGYPITYCYDVVEGYHQKLISSLVASE